MKSLKDKVVKEDLVSFELAIEIRELSVTRMVKAIQAAG